MTVPTVLVHRDQEVLAKAVAARLVTRLVDVQSARGGAHLVLTGGGVGTASLAEVAATPAHDAVDWRHLDIWWGDERFLPSGHEERNETAARQVLLDRMDVDESRVHPMPASDQIESPEEAAERYAADLRARTHPDDHGEVPSFDILMLGLGPDGHVASLFPGFDQLDVDDDVAVPVTGSPKPPPERISLTLPALRSARRAVILAAGQDKADAALRASRGEVPSGMIEGAEWMLDRAAASLLPSS